MAALGSGKCYPFNQMKFHQATGFYVAESGQDKSGPIFDVYISEIKMKIMIPIVKSWTILFIIQNRYSSGKIK